MKLPFFDKNVYTRILSTIQRSIEKNQEIEIEIANKDFISKIKMPKWLNNFAIESGLSIEAIINLIIKYFVIDFKYGYIRKNRNIIRLLYDYPKLDFETKRELIKYLLEHLNAEESII